MKRKITYSPFFIKLPNGAQQDVAKELNCTCSTVSNALNFIADSVLATKIREYALEHGGEMVCNFEQKFELHFSIVVCGGMKEVKTITDLCSMYIAKHRVKNGVVLDYEDADTAMYNMRNIKKGLEKVKVKDVYRLITNNDYTMLSWKNVKVTLEYTQLEHRYKNEEEPECKMLL